jgi:molybdopterin converting factor small subunit
MFRITKLVRPGIEPETIRVSLRYYNIVADLLERQSEEKVLPSGITVEALVMLLAAENPVLVPLAAHSPGTLPAHLRLFRAGRAVLHPHELLADGDEIRLFPAISGG